MTQTKKLLNDERTKKRAEGNKKNEWTDKCTKKNEKGRRKSHKTKIKVVLSVCRSKKTAHDVGQMSEKAHFLLRRKRSSDVLSLKSDSSGCLLPRELALYTPPLTPRGGVAKGQDLDVVEGGGTEVKVRLYWVLLGALRRFVR